MKIIKCVSIEKDFCAAVAHYRMGPATVFAKQVSKMITHLVIEFRRERLGLKFLAEAIVTLRYLPNMGIDRDGLRVVERH